MSAKKLAAVGLGLVLLTAMSMPAGAAVTINEMKVKSTEFIELYNSGPGDVNLSGWTLDDGSGPESLSGTIAAGGFLSIATTLTLNNSGAVVVLADNNGRDIDVVGYGRSGGAPVGFNSIGRSPDGDDTNDDARDFEYLDDTVNPNGETPGAPNAHGEPALGSSVIINELDPFGTGNPDGLDRMEIYNPLSAPVNIQGFVVSDGDGYCVITAPITVPALGFVVLTELEVGEGFDCPSPDVVEFSSADVAYLFDANHTRIDQLGISGAPFLDPPDTLQRCPDGFGPNDGYDYLSSGGDVSYFADEQSLGSANNCPVSAVEPATWGRVKSVYR
jgi:hypothetical protein